MSRTPVRLCAALAAASAVLLASPALAHVTVSSPDAASGGWGKAVFRVPNESEDASTTRLTITLPADAPLASVTAQPKPGWELQVEEGDLPEPVEVDGTTLTRAVRSVTWTTDGSGIAPGQFDEFSLSGGPFPDTDSMSFAAEQVYDDGEVVAWDEVASDDAAEPDHPAPELELTSATADDSATEQEATSVDWLPRVLSGVALVLAAAALALVLRENRRRA